LTSRLLSELTDKHHRSPLLQHSRNASIQTAIQASQKRLPSPNQLEANEFSIEHAVFCALYSHRNLSQIIWELTPRTWTMEGFKRHQRTANFVC
jgi:hypothetical protein